MTLGSTEHTEFYGYNAESYNPNTGLEYLRARYYNPNKGRFFQEDSYLGNIMDPLTLNRYAYTKNSPLNYVDPSGHSSKSLVSNLTNLRESVMTKLLHSMETQSTVEIIPGILSISMQDAMDASEVTDCFLEETASEIIGFIEEMSYYMGYLGVGLALPPLWKGWNSLLEDKIEGPIVNQILNAEYYYSGKAQADLFIAALGKSLDNILWNTVTDLGLILGAIGNSGGPLAGALSGGGISVSAGAVVVTVGEAALIGIIGGVAVAGGSQILQSEGKSNASKNQEKADNAEPKNGELRDTRNIRYSQDSINGTFEDGTNVNDLIFHLKNTPEYAAEVEPIRIVKFKDLPSEVQTYLSQQGVSSDSVFTLDNRRLYAAKQAGVKVNTVWATQKDLESIDLFKRFTTVTGGKSISVR